MISGPRPSNLADRIQELDLNREDRMTRAQRMIGPVAAALLLAVTAVTTQAQPQFAGTWTLEPAQSQFPAREGGHGHQAPDGAQPETPKQPPTVKASRRAGRRQHHGDALDGARQSRALVQPVVRRRR